MNSRFLPAASLSHQQNYVASDEDMGAYTETSLSSSCLDFNELA